MALPVSGLRSKRSSLRRHRSSFLPISNKEMEEKKGVGQGGQASPPKAAGLLLQKARKGLLVCQQPRFLVLSFGGQFNPGPANCIIWEYCGVHWLSLPMQPGNLAIAVAKRGKTWALSELLGKGFKKTLRENPSIYMKCLLSPREPGPSRCWVGTGDNFIPRGLWPWRFTRWCNAAVTGLGCTSRWLQGKAIKPRPTPDLGE